MYTEESLASQGNVIHQGVGGGVPAQQQIYVDQLTGRQVILEEGAQVTRILIITGCLSVCTEGSR